MRHSSTTCIGAPDDATGRALRPVDSSGGPDGDYRDGGDGDNGDDLADYDQGDDVDRELEHEASSSYVDGVGSDGPEGETGDDEEYQPGDDNVDDDDMDNDDDDVENGSDSEVDNNGKEDDQVGSDENADLDQDGATGDLDGDDAVSTPEASDQSPGGKQTRQPDDQAEPAGSLAEERDFHASTVGGVFLEAMLQFFEPACKNFLYFNSLQKPETRMAGNPGINHRAVHQNRLI